MKIHMAKFKHFFIFSFFLSLSSVGHAAGYINFLIEPTIGYQKSLSGEASTLPDATEYEYSGLTYGASVAMVTPTKSFGLGGEFLLGQVDSSTKTGSAAAVSEEANKVDGSLIALFNIGLFRIVPKYIFSSKTEISSGASIDDAVSGQGLGLKVGLHIFKYMSLDLSYNTLKYKEGYSEATKLTSSIEPIRLSEFMVTLAFPIYIDMGFLKIFDF